MAWFWVERYAFLVYHPKWNNTLVGFVTGRPRLYQSNAERQRAYRERLKANQKLQESVGFLATISTFKREPKAKPKPKAKPELRSEPAYQCHNCGQWYRGWYRLEHHLFEHNPKHWFSPYYEHQRYRCYSCGEWFRTLRELLKHRRVVHKASTKADFARLHNNAYVSGC